MKTLPVSITIILYIAFGISACVPPPLTMEPTKPVPVPDSVPSPTNAPNALDMPISAPSPTSLPPPLVEIFPQAGDAVEFIFPDNQPDLISRQFTENGNCIHSGAYGFQLTYNFTEGGNGGWGVHWAVPPVTHFSATGFNALTFWVKGIAGDETFRIGLKDTGKLDVRGDEKEILVDSSRYVLVSSSDWKPVIITLSHFADDNGPVNVASIENISFGFDQSKGSGSICIDDIAFK